MSILAIYGCINPKNNQIVEVHNLYTKDSDTLKSFLFFVAEHLQENYKFNIEQQLFNFLENNDNLGEGVYKIPNTSGAISVYEMEMEITTTSHYINLYEKITRRGYIYNTTKMVKQRTFFLTKNEIEPDFTEMEIVSPVAPFNTKTEKETIQEKSQVKLQEAKPIVEVDGFMEELTEKLKIVRIKSDIDLHVTGFTTRKRKKRRRYD